MKHSCNSTRQLSRAVETDIEYVVGNAKCCFTSLKAHRIVTPMHLEAEKWLREWFPIIFVHRFMWNINMAQFFGADFVFCMKPTPFFFRLARRHASPVSPVSPFEFVYSLYTFSSPNCRDFARALRNLCSFVPSMSNRYALSVRDKIFLLAVIITFKLMDGAPCAESSFLNRTSIAEQKVHIILALRFEEADHRMRIA